MIYHSNSDINKNKIAIGKNIKDNSAILSYIASPEITYNDFNINIMYKGNEYEGNFIPIKYDNIYANQYIIDISNLSNFNKLLLTNKYYNNLPLYFKEIIPKRGEDAYIQISINSTIVNTGYLIEEDGTSFIIYHNFSISDNPKIIYNDRKSSDIFNLTYQHVFTKVSARDKYSPGEFCVFPEDKIIKLGLDSNINYNNVTVSSSRNGSKFNYFIKAECGVEYTSNQTYNLAIVSNYNNHA